MKSTHGRHTPLPIPNFPSITIFLFFCLKHKSKYVYIYKCISYRTRIMKFEWNDLSNSHLSIINHAAMICAAALQQSVNCITCHLEGDFSIFCSSPYPLPFTCHPYNCQVIWLITHCFSPLLLRRHVWEPRTSLNEIFPVALFEKNWFFATW